MGSPVINNAPSSPSSSSSSSSSSRIHMTVENVGEDRDGLEVETKLSDMNRVEEFNQDENQLNFEIEKLERKCLMLMLEKGLKDYKLDKYGEEKEIEGCEILKQKKSEQMFLDLMLEIGETNDKFKDLGIRIEANKKYEKGQVFKELGTDLARQHLNPRQLVSDKKELAEKFEKMGNVVDDDGLNTSDGEEEEEIGKIEARELCKEIEGFGLLDLQMIMEEVEALKGPEKMMSEMEVKMGELESGLCELKSAILELKGKKSKELMAWVTKEEKKELECFGQEEMNARKLNWGSIIVSVGAIVVAAAAVVFMGHTRVKAKAERGNEHKAG
ncbi:hypothetical protein DITRI_Ditri19aG0059700 [Diplodiscus trichospermus]